MTIKELIQELKHFPPDAKVLVETKDTVVGVVTTSFSCARNAVYIEAYIEEKDNGRDIRR
jgi:hypothetical protein